MTCFAAINDVIYNNDTPFNPLSAYLRKKRIKGGVAYYQNSKILQDLYYKNELCLLIEKKSDLHVMGLHDFY